MASDGLTLNMLSNRVLYLLREETYNQDPSQPPNIPSPADFPQAWLTTDLNYAQQLFMSATGWAPRLTEKMVSLPMVAGLDYVLPADLVSLTRIEYQSPALSANPYKLIERNFDAFDMITSGGFNLGDVGAPTDYRSPFGSQASANVAVRMWPAPTYGNAGQASGSLVITNVPLAGDTVFAFLSNGISNVTVGPYVVLATDNIYSIALALSGLINASTAVTGVGAFLQTTFTLGSNSIQLASIATNTVGNGYTYRGQTVGQTKISPTASTNLSGGGLPDNIILYYTSNGTLMVQGTDFPGIPTHYHGALADYVLSIYWRRKNDPTQQADKYRADWMRQVHEAKAYPLDSDRASTPAFVDEESVDGGLYVSSSLGL